MAAVEQVFPDVVLQWEDFLKENALRQLARFRDQLCTFNDDIQGTAAVVLAGLLRRACASPAGAMRDQRVVFAGAGASAQGIAGLLVAALMEDGLTGEEARRGGSGPTDSRGLVDRDRPRLEDFKATYARPAEEVAGYACADPVADHAGGDSGERRPTVLIGTSATPRHLRRGAWSGPWPRSDERPIIFPLSNPTSKAECTPGGRGALDARGERSWPPAARSRRSSTAGGGTAIGQCNNAFVFPGVGLGPDDRAARAA